jgi:succinate dehydrogenase/fumarate reductase-like Fe-S protein
MEISMSDKLTIRAFFFNSKTDYLPYYKNFTMRLDDVATTKDMLIRIKEENEDFSFPEEKLYMKINGWVVDENQSAASVVEKLGNELQIDPVSTYRSNNGLIINDDDFMSSYALLEPYATEDDLKFYETLYALHYASETSSFDREYIGDAILVLAHKMIGENTEHKEAILKAISTVHSGLFDCEYENNLFDEQKHEDDISTLKEMARAEDTSFLSKLKSRFSSKTETKNTAEGESVVYERKSKVVTIENLIEKNIAYYPALSENKSVDALVEKSDITLVNFSRSKKLSGMGIYADSKLLSYKKAGATLLDAFDSAAEVLVIEDIEQYDIFVANFSNIEKAVGRKMIGFELICSQDFIKQLS